jgi:hypothetical protein
MIPLGTPITGTIGGPGIPSNPPPSVSPAMSQQYEVLRLEWHTDEVGAPPGLYAHRPSYSWETCTLSCANWWSIMTRRTEDYSATSNATVYSLINWATTNNHCFVDVRPENLPWQTMSTYQSNTSCPGDPICSTDWPSKKVWFGTWENNGSAPFSYQCQYGNVFQAQGLQMYRLRDRAEMTLRAPRQYGTNTTVLFTFDGVESTGPRDSQTGELIEPLDLSQVKFWGQPPVAWSNETQTVTYLVSVDGGREYTINQDSFEWPHLTSLRQLSGPYGPVLSTEDVHWLQVTNFHNQVEPMEVMEGSYGFLNS